MKIRPYGCAEPRRAPRGPLAPDVTRATTFAMESAEQLRDVGMETAPGEFYPRYGHPAGREFERRVATLEGGEGAVSFASGMAAFHGLFFTLLSAGETIAVSRDVYGGVSALLQKDLPRFGIEVRRFDPFDPGSLKAVLAGSVRLVHVETPTNPLCRVVDLRRIVEQAHGARALVSVDGTFVPPPLQRALRQGADIALQSATKFLGGHSDAVGGVVTSRHEILEPLERFRRRTGGILGPDTAWLLTRSLSTLELRARQASETAFRLARYLEEGRTQVRGRDPGSGRGPGVRVERVHYPGLPGHPDLEVARRQMDGFGALFAFEVQGGLPAAIEVYDRFEVIARAVSLGGIQTVASLPLHTSHAALTPEERRAAGIADGLIRISVGLDSYEDLERDLSAALRW